MKSTNLSSHSCFSPREKGNVFSAEAMLCFSFFLTIFAQPTVIKILAREGSFFVGIYLSSGILMRLILSRFINQENANNISKKFIKTYSFLMLLIVLSEAYFSIHSTLIFSILAGLASGSYMVFQLISDTALAQIRNESESRLRNASRNILATNIGMFVGFVTGGIAAANVPSYMIFIIESAVLFIILLVMKFSRESPKELVVEPPALPASPMLKNKVEQDFFGIIGLFAILSKVFSECSFRVIYPIYSFITLEMTSKTYGLMMALSLAPGIALTLIGFDIKIFSKLSGFRSLIMLGIGTSCTLFF